VFVARSARGRPVIASGLAVPTGTVPDSRTTAPQYCEAVPGGLVFKARRLFVSLDSRPRVIKKKKRLRRVRLIQRIHGS
jgi:hypothetical protein